MSEGDLIYPKIKERAEEVFRCDVPRCTNIIRDGVHCPRGVFYLGDAPPKLLLLTKMPGGIFTDMGEQRWSDYEESVEWEKRCFSEFDGDGLKFHIRILRYLEFILHSNFLSYDDTRLMREELTENIFREVYKTHLVKCTCSIPEPNREAGLCLHEHLRDELEYCENPPILCLGDFQYDIFRKFFPSYLKVTKIKDPSRPISEASLGAELERVQRRLGF